MSTKRRSITIKTADGGQMTLTPHIGDLSATITATKGYQETPEQRRARLSSPLKANTFESGKRRRRGGRGNSKAIAIRESAE